MLALIAGQGRLPVVLARRLAADHIAFQVFELAGFGFENPDKLAVETFRIERLGGLIDDLLVRGFGDVCFAGAIKRPAIDRAQIDGATALLLDKIVAAMGKGDDGALRVVIRLFEDRGLNIRAAHEIAPDLLPAAGVLGLVLPGAGHVRSAQTGWRVLADQGAADLGQASVIRGDTVLAREGQDGTDAMLAGIRNAQGGIFFKGPKPGQDMRADMPVIGVETVHAVVRAGLAGIVIEAGGVLVLDQAAVIDACNSAGIFLTVVEAP